MNILHFELRSLRTRTLLWILLTIALIAMYMSIYPAFAKDADQLLATLKNLPPAMHHIMGMGGEMKLFSFLGFWGNIFPFITLIGAIQASVTGLGLLSKEPATKTTDFLLTKPRTRQSIYGQKVLAGAISLIVTAATVTVAAFLLAAAFGAGNFDGRDYLMFWGVFALIQAWFFSLGLLVSQVVHRLKSTVPYALAMSFGFFLFALFGMIVGDDAVRWLTPFRFIDYQKIVTDSAYDPGHFLYGCALILVFVAVSYVIYTRKDVPAAV